MSPFLGSQFISEVAPWCLGEILDFRLSKSPKNELSRDFFSPKLSLESWILHCIRENLSEYPRDVTVEKLRIVSSTALFTA